MLVARHATPRTIERGLTTSLTLDVRDDTTDIQSTPTSGTLTLMDGSETVLNAVSVTTGPPPSYSLLAATTTSRSLSDQLLEVWTLVISGTTYTFTRPAMLVRRAYRPNITDTDLTNYFAEVAELKASGQTSWATKRGIAAEWIEREIFKRGQRIHLIFDTFQLYEPHVLKSLALIYAEAHHLLGAEKYGAFAKDFDEQATKIMSEVQFRQDTAETGTIDTNDTVGAPAIFATSGPNHRRDSFRRGWY